MEAAFQGLRPASTALIVVAGLSVAFSVFFGLPSVSFTGITGVEWKAVVLAAAVFAAMKWSPLKKLHPIVFILASAWRASCSSCEPPIRPGHIQTKQERGIP